MKFMVVCLVFLVFGLIGLPVIATKISNPKNVKDRSPDP